MSADDVLATAIKQLRARRSQSQQALAVELGTSVRTIAHWESGRLPGHKGLLDLWNVASRTGNHDIAKSFSMALGLEYYQDGLPPDPLVEFEKVLVDLLLTSVRNDHISTVGRRLADVRRLLLANLDELEKILRNGGSIIGMPLESIEMLRSDIAAVGIERDDANRRNKARRKRP